MNLPLADARRAALSATRNVLELAHLLKQRGQLAKVEYTSTVGVAGRLHRLLREDWVGSDHAFHNSYEQAKAEAEVLVRRAVDDGLPVTVHRPSMVVGDSTTGRVAHYQVFYYLADFLGGVRTRGIFPRLGNARLDIVPSNVVADAIVQSSADPANAGKILHLCGGPQDAIELLQLQRAIHERMRLLHKRVPRPRYVSRRLFAAATSALARVSDARTRAALGTLPMFLDYLESNQLFDNSRTLEWFRQAGVTTMPTAEFLPRILDRYLHERQ